MYGYLFRRLLGTIPVMLVVAIFIFLMLRLTPSDPAAIIAGDNATTEQVAKIRGQLGLDQPMVEQFFIWSGKVLSGDFGDDLRVAAQVCDLIAVMQRGVIVEQGTTSEVFAAPRHEYTKALFDAAPGRNRDFFAGAAAGA
jgi:ABC-type antimicrobial peptide transport system ATPase subunit